MVSSRSFTERTMVCSSISFNFPSNISPSKVSTFNFRPMFFLYCRGRESGLSIPGEDTSRLNAPSIRSSSSILFESFLLISEQLSIGSPASPSISTKTRWLPETPVTVKSTKNNSGNSLIMSSSSAVSFWTSVIISFSNKKRGHKSPLFFFLFTCTKVIQKKLNSNSIVIKASCIFASSKKFCQ